MREVSWHCVENWFIRLRPDARPALAPAAAPAMPLETAPLGQAEVQVDRGTGASR